MQSSHRQSTPQGSDLIRFFEGFSPIVYICAAGVKTVGYGHALKRGEDERFKNGITEPEALELLKKDMMEAEIAVSRLIKVPLEDCQFDALVSFVYNLGSGALQRSSLRSKLNRGEYYDASLEFDKWVWGGGRKLPGLIRRRRTERILFTTGVLLL